MDSNKEIQSPLAHLTEEQIEAIGEEFENLHSEVYADLGQRDADYIHGIIGLQRRLVLLGRVLLAGAEFRPLWAAGTATLSLAKILENMEIGHNVMHGQWDWMNHPEINSSTWDWDTASSKESWKHSHNYIHHTFTNIRGKDKDLGYEIMRIDPHQPWNPVYLFQPFYNLLLMFLFEWGVAVHDMDIEAIRAGEKDMSEVKKDLANIWGKARAQITKDYIAWPLLGAVVVGGFEAGRMALGFEPGTLRHGTQSKSRKVRQGLRGARDRTKGRSFGRQDAVTLLKGALTGSFERGAPEAIRTLDALRPGGRSKTRRARRGLGRAWGRTAPEPVRTDIARPVEAGRRAFKKIVWANATANIIRNVWSHSIIFCGHFPDQTYTFSQEEAENETKGATYIRQLVGAANIEGGPLFHVISGNLGFQVEHHLYPDMPSTRYGEIAPRVREICERYGLPYNTGPFSQQLYMVHRTIARLAFPGGKPRSKPGPYHREQFEEHDVAAAPVAA
jgi:NADPH-dependent stearoyl-CoA 9-desaturase